jgi:hypothetical protein
MSKENLKDMLDNIIADNSEQAEIEFHKHLQDKMQQKLQGTDVSVEDEDTDD